jgi:hypothetical protein
MPSYKGFKRRATSSDHSVDIIFEVITTASTLMAVFWVVVPCRLVNFTDVSEVLAAFTVRVIAFITAVAIAIPVATINPVDFGPLFIYLTAHFSIY